MILRDAILAKRIGETRLERRREIIEGELIAVGGRVQVNANDDTVVWVRGWDESGGIFQSLNLTVKPLARLPVLVARDPNVEYGHEILSLNTSVLAGLDDKGILPAFNVPNHHESHEWPDWPGTVGPDPVIFYPRAFGPGRVYVGPDDEGLEISVAPFRYMVNGELRFFRGTRRYDLSAHQPASGEALLLLIGVIAATGAVSVTAGASGPDDDLRLPAFVDAPAGVIGLCYLRLDADQTRVVDRDFIVDLRLLPGGGGIGVGYELIRRVTLNYNSSSPVVIFTPPANATILKIKSRVTTAFDASGAGVVIGIAGNTDKYVGAGEINLARAGIYTTEILVDEDSTPDEIIATFTAGTGGSAGAARIHLYYGVLE